MRPRSTPTTRWVASTALAIALAYSLGRLHGWLQLHVLAGLVFALASVALCAWIAKRGAARLIEAAKPLPPAQQDMLDALREVALRPRAVRPFPVSETVRAGQMVALDERRERRPIPAECTECAGSGFVAKLLPSGHAEAQCEQCHGTGVE